jgi:phage I-like protein
MRAMNDSSKTRAGGDRGDNPRKFLGFSRVETAGAPAFGVAGDHGAPPEWIQLVPAGSFHGRDGRGPYVLADPEAVIAATKALRMRAGIPIDYDHATDLAAPQGSPAPAAGWITEFAIRSGALWGRVEWTERAALAIRAHEYRYISPVFQYAPSDGTITRLLRAGLTNNPNLYLTAISAAGDEESNMDEFLKQLREMLGLSADASTDDILKRIGVTVAAAASLDNDAAASHRAGSFDPARYVAVAEFQQALTELNALKMQRAREKAEHAVDEAIRSGKLVPAHREWAISYCAADPRGFDTFAARQPLVLAGEMNLGGIRKRRSRDRMRARC